MKSKGQVMVIRTCKFIQLLPTQEWKVVVISGEHVP